MDSYVTSTLCGDPKNFAYADSKVTQSYHDLATKYALADRWFPPVVGSSSSNDMYFATTRFEFTDFFDHVPPPPDSKVDNKAYGLRVPILAIGPFAKQNFILHVTLEHSSVVKFIEWKWLDHQTGQLAARDTVVHNIGSLLDPGKTGTPVPG